MKELKYALQLVSIYEYSNKVLEEVQDMLQQADKHFDSGEAEACLRLVDKAIYTLQRQVILMTQGDWDVANED